jgi:MFS family permease
MINFSRSFNLAWERMVVILFQPFDLGKWFVIGFSAFLAGLIDGGNGINPFNFPTGNNNNLKRTTWLEHHAAFPLPPTGVAHAWAQSTFPSLSPSLSPALPAAWLMNALTTGIGIFIFSLIFSFALLFILLFYWLGARGQFLLLDNLARNRAEIAWPWRTYARQGNALFLFCLLCGFLVFAVLVPIFFGDFFLAQPFLRQNRWPQGGEIPLVVLAGLLTLAVALAGSVLFFLFRELGVPLMFRNGIGSRAAFVETWRLLLRYPGSLLLLVVLRIALFVALVVFQVIVCCFNCCLELIPYIGTVLILPALLYIKCFTLDCLAQFGPEYDVWTVDLPPGAPTLPASVTPPPPLL